MVNFDNTQIAFANMSDNALRKAYWMFRLVSNPSLTSFGASLLNFALSIKFPVTPIVRGTVFQHFCGGESIVDCENKILQLAEYNVKTILDYSVEGKQDEADFDRCYSMAMEAIERAKVDNNVPFSVVKLTGLIPFDLLKKSSAKKELSESELTLFNKGKSRVKRLCEAAFKADIPFMIDAEESWIQDAIDEIAVDMMQQFNKEKALVYNTAQMYRHDRLSYIKALHEKAEKENFHVGLKIVRGAYMEKERDRAAEKGYPSPIQHDKAASDRDYDAALSFIIERLDKMGLIAGTHNEKSSLYLTELMEKHQIEKGNPKVYFSQLLGMSDHISYNLSKAGYNVAKYVPYGPIIDVMPYLIRRAEENTSVAGQTGRELSLIMQELKRRRKSA